MENSDRGGGGAEMHRITPLIMLNDPELVKVASLS